MPNITSQLHHMLKLKSRIEGSDPHPLIGLLYEELIRSLDLIIVHCKQGDDVVESEPVIRAVSILNALEESLDFDKGGDMAIALARIYRSARQELSAGDLTKLNEIQEVICTIAYTWRVLGK